MIYAWGSAKTSGQLLGSPSIKFFNLRREVAARSVRLFVAPFVGKINCY